MVFPVSCASPVLSHAPVFRLDNFFAIGSLEPTHDEMSSRHILKMFNERVIHCGTAYRTYDWNSQRCPFKALREAIERRLTLDPVTTMQ